MFEVKIIRDMRGVIWNKKLFVEFLVSLIVFFLDFLNVDMCSNVELEGRKLSFGWVLVKIDK